MFKTFPAVSYWEKMLEKCNLADFFLLNWIIFGHNSDAIEDIKIIST